MITPNTKVADIAAESLAAIRVFQKYGIDFCCGGQKPLAEVCQKKNLAADAVTAELEAALKVPAPDQTDWSARPLRELTEYIVARHHSYLRTELPRIQAWLDKVCSKYGEQDKAILGLLPETFGALRSELEGHLPKEENILFPWIGRFESAVASGEEPPRLPFGTFDGPINVMEHEHENAGDALRILRESTRNYTPPPHACRTYRALFEGLEELEADLHMHIHLENNVLHRRARQMFARSGAAAGQFVS